MKSPISEYIGHLYYTIILFVFTGSGIRSRGSWGKSLNRQTSVIGPKGGVIDLLTWNIKMTIPPGALNVEQELSLAALRDPPDLKMQPNEMLVSCGFQCSPSGIAFKYPITITIPHCGKSSHPRATRAILYGSNSDKGNWTLIANV